MKSTAIPEVDLVKMAQKQAGRDEKNKIYRFFRIFRSLNFCRANFQKGIQLWKRNTKFPLSGRES